MPDRFTPLLFPELESESQPEIPRLPDADARAAALEVRRSFVVEAPAGSGKTGLLIQRYMKLLADDAVLQPEQVLAITFTNKAAGEMRDRVLAQLESARRNEPAGSDFERLSRDLAGAVLERDRRLGWRLLEQPHRLNLRTIDSLCAQIARNLPVLSGSAGALRPTEDAEPLFRDAARRTLGLLADGGGDAALQAALRDLLLHRDASLKDCEDLLVEMLAVRDQWGMLIPLDRARLDDAELDREVLPKLQATLDEAICADLQRVERVFPPDLLAEIAELAGHFGHAAPMKAGASPLAPCRGRHDAPEAVAEERGRWVAIAGLLLTKGGAWRKERGLTGANLGFEYERRHPLHTRLCDVLDRLEGRDDLLDELCRLADLPDAVYPAAQWALAKSLFRVLRRALVELQLVFAERGACDFTEVSLLARAALGEGAGPDEMATALGASLQHLLVDEMQDTSTGQYELIRMLTADWDGASQTVFLVGDPRQSIYLFRQARVEHFMHTLHTGRLGELKLARLRLTANFRSQRRLVEQFNEDFGAIFGVAARTGTAAAADRSSTPALPYRPADAVQGETAGAEARRWHTRTVSVPARDDDAAPLKAPLLRQRQARRNAARIRELALRWLQKPLAQGRKEPWRVAVLVRNRRHLAEVVSEFQRDDAPGGRVPYKATDIEPLSERQEVLDLLALTRALLHPADRVAGLALLRAPWCGLALADLHMLTGADQDGFANYAVGRLMEERGDLLSGEGCARMERLWRVLQAAERERGRMSTAERVERAWRSLGGDAALRNDEMTNARRYFELLDEMESKAGSAPEFRELNRRLERLYAEPQSFPEETVYVELLTMHRAKGLEWDVVLIPALERWPGRTRPRLLTWADLGDGRGEGDETRMMLAPIAARGEKVDKLTVWLKRKYAEQEAAERRRLFYVAATRAREELHLFASPDKREGGEVKPARESLLESAWAAAGPRFARVASLESLAVAKLAVQPGTGLELAAGAEVVEMPARDRASRDGNGSGAELEATTEPLYAKPPRPEIVRLPESVRPEERFRAARAEKLRYRGEEGGASAEAERGGAGFARPEGSLAARALGNAVHALLELVAARIARGERAEEIAGELMEWRARIGALLRAEGIAPAEVERLTQETTRALRNALGDRDGLWVLAAHAGSGSEYALVGSRTDSGGLYSIRVDRMFLAGAEPGSFGQECLWVVDYKTASHSGSGVEEFLGEQRRVYAPQLEGYARVLAAERGIGLERVRVGLYYTALPRLVWWVPV